MKTYRPLFESHSYKEISLLSKFLKTAYNMDFIIIGGAAHSLYTGARAKDLDLVVKSLGTLKEEPDVKYNYVDPKGTPLKISVKGVSIDLLYPGMDYGKFKIRSNFRYNTIKGNKVLSLEDLMNTTKQKDRKVRFEELIRSQNLTVDFANKLDRKTKEDYIKIFNSLR